MEIPHESIRHLRYLRQSLMQDNESIGFFLAAGCPLSVSMPEGQWPLIPDVLNLTKQINESLSANSDHARLIAEMKKAEGNVENIEAILSFLRSLIQVAKGGDVRGLTEKALIDLEKKVCAAIVNRINVGLPNLETPYHYLCNWVTSIERKHAVEIFTTNYDLLVEQSFEDNGAPYFDGFVGSRRSFFDLRAVEDNLIPKHWTRLWKIHGSINWQLEDRGGQRYVCRTSDVKLDAAHLIYPSHLKYQESRKMPYLALIDQLNRFIRRKSSLLVICGYSFNDEHINDTIVNALKANPTAMVLGLMYGGYRKASGEETYPEAIRLAKKQHNLNIWMDDAAIVGTNFGVWGAPRDTEDTDAELRQFIKHEAIVGGPADEKRFIVKLGDFSNFAQFLKQIIGSGARSADV